MRDRRRWVWLERLLVLVGVVCLGWWTTRTVHGWYFRSQQVSLFESLRDSAGAGSLPRLPEPVKPVVSRDPAPDPAGLVGILEVPRLDISTPVISGDDEQALDVAAGHLADTPFPWEHGNSAVAAHRDGLFRSLERVRYGDVVRIRTARGDFEYTVRGTKIVNPDDLSVLERGRADAITLITCYPFGFIGHAPQRFIVRAERAGPPAAVPTPASAGRIKLVSTSSSGVTSPPTARVAKPRPAKRASVNTRVAPRDTVKRDAKKRQTITHQPRKTADASRRPAPKGEKPKKKKWYRLFF